METNTLALQVLVMAHAAYGHNAFFKSNYLFRQFTQADGILDYLTFARNFIVDCEERYGWRDVERILDCCHALAPYGVDRYKKPARLSASRERARLAERMRFAEKHYRADVAYLYEHAAATEPAEEVFEPQENLLYFIEKRAPKLAPWQRELVRIVRKVAQYFYPQRLTKVANEGAATFWHYTLLHELYDHGQVDDGFMLEWLSNHSDVVAQPAFDAPHFRGINPYTLGFALYRDIRRMCEQPTDEDREWFPSLAGSDWQSAIHFAMSNFKDESLIEQYLSPKLMRELRLFMLGDEETDRSRYMVRAIHNDAGYRTAAPEPRRAVPPGSAHAAARGDALLGRQRPRAPAAAPRRARPPARKHLGRGDPAVRARALAVRRRDRGSRPRRQAPEDPPDLILGLQKKTAPAGAVFTSGPWLHSQYTTTYRPIHTTSTKCQYQAAASKAKW